MRLKVEPRAYQQAIFEKAKRQNCLIVLPTGMGKTLIGIMLALYRLETFPNSKILVLAPTKPLVEQHFKAFIQQTDLEPSEVVSVTGKLRPEQRFKLYSKKVIIATPHVIKNDLKAKKLDLKDFSCLIFDEAHHAIGDYPYTFIAKCYANQAKNQLILGLTASPGWEVERINQIKRNLFIETVEIRSEFDEDIKRYFKGVETETIKIEFPAEFLQVLEKLRLSLETRKNGLKKLGLNVNSRKDCLNLQARLQEAYKQGIRSRQMFEAMRLLAEYIKLDHALTLFETQGLSAFLGYFLNLKPNERSDKEILMDKNVKEALSLAQIIKLKNMEHPKLGKLVDLVKGLLLKGKKLLVFANYRSTCESIREALKSIGIDSKILIGHPRQAKDGLSQKEQIEVLEDFKQGKFKVLIATSVGEEGLDIVDVDMAIFYDCVPSEIRLIQRRGRVGRHGKGKVIFLVTKGTREESYYWMAWRKEKRMRSLVKSMRKKSLMDWLTRI